MGTQALDFSDLGAKPVPQPEQASGQLDFSDLGARRVDIAPSAASPISPPTLAKPSVPMHKVMLWGGTSENPDLQRPLAEQLGELGGRALQSSVNPVTIGHRLAQRMNIAPEGDLWPNELTMKQFPSAAAATFFGMGAEPDAPVPQFAPRAEIPAATAEQPGMFGRLVDVMKRRASHIPGVQAAKDFNYVMRGPSQSGPAAPPAAAATPDYGTPQALRGKMIPQQADALRSLPRSVALPASQTGEALGQSPRLVDQIKASAPPPRATLIEQMGGKPVETITQPADLYPAVTENPFVGRVVRAMDRSGVPIAQRPSFLLKGSGRINRILGPEEDLTDIMSKSVRQAQRSKLPKD